jgi:hypothetical protein
MRSGLSFIIVVWLTVLVCAAAPPAPPAPSAPPAPPATATQAAAQRLIDLAPRLTNADPVTRSLDAVVTLGPDMLGLSIRTIYQAPDHYAWYVIDPSDGTPIVAVADGKLVAYDPADGVLLWGNNASARLTLEIAEKKLNLDFGYDAREKPPPKPWNIVMDIKSLAQAPARSEVRSVPGPGGRSILRRISQRGNILEFLIDADASPPVQRVQMISPHGQLILAIDAVRLNQAIDPRLFSMPSRKALEKDFVVKDLPGDGVFAKLKGLKSEIQSLTIRPAQKNPWLRAKFEKDVPNLIDWAKAAENDKIMAPKLRTLFRVAMPSTQPAE